MLTVSDEVIIESYILDVSWQRDMTDYTLTNHRTLSGLWPDKPKNPFSVLQFHLATPTISFLNMFTFVHGFISSSRTLPAMLPLVNFLIFYYEFESVDQPRICNSN